MKRISLICLLAFVCSLLGYSQFWIGFGWNEPHCQSCLWMAEALRLPSHQAAEYHKIVHKYGRKIEREAQKEYRYWDKAARKIYDLRMERDRKLERLLGPSQFRMYVRFVRERPSRIHDYRGWYKNPHDAYNRPSRVCSHYEDKYWKHAWEHTDSHYDRPRAPMRSHQPQKPHRPPQSHKPAKPHKPHKHKDYDDEKWHKGKYDRD